MSDRLQGIDGPVERTDLRWAALRTSVGLSLLFLVVYSGTSWITSLRSDVGTWMYEWERWIPFVPIMIVPYMSLDLFFVAAPFLCTDREELRTLRRRIAMAILVAGACFLLMPLQLGRPRPEVAGWLGVVWDRFLSFDRPVNLCPSLHIALRTLLVVHYARHTRGLLRVLVHVWFALIGVSTLLTAQHHVIDVAGGFVLAAACFWAISPGTWRAPTEGNPRVGLLYGIGATALGLLALLLRGHGGWALWWPAAVLGLVAAAYLLGPLGPGAAIYRKHDGRLPLATRLLLAPVLLGQWASWTWYAWLRRGPRSEPWDVVVPGLWIGRLLTVDEAHAARRAGATAVLDLTSEFSEPSPLRELPYLNVPLLDLTAPDPCQMAACLAFIDAHAPQGAVLVHCKAGYSRSAAVVATWLLRRGRAADADSALALVREARPRLVVRPEAMAAIR